MSDMQTKIAEARSDAMKLIASGRPFIMTITPLPLENETRAPSPISCVATPTSNIQTVVYALALHFHFAHDLIARAVELVAPDFPGGEDVLKAHINSLLDRFAQTHSDCDGCAGVIPPQR